MHARDARVSQPIVHAFIMAKAEPVCGSKLNMWQAEHVKLLGMEKCTHRCPAVEAIEVVCVLTVYLFAVDIMGTIHSRYAYA